MKKWALVVDVSLCVNCRNCVLATKDEYFGNEFAGYSAPQPAGGVDTIQIERHARGAGSMVDVTYVPKTCNHCDDAPCIRAAGDGSIYKRADGIVMIDPGKARGRRDLVSACPYGMIQWNETASVPQQWNFDAHLLDQGWKEPRCSQACPTKALTAIQATDQELQRKVDSQELTVLHPEYNTAPRVFYRHLRERLSHLVCGNLTSTDSKGQLMNLVGAEVSLHDSGEGAPRTATTDHFGDFRFSGLRANISRIRLIVRYRETERTVVERPRVGSINLGVLAIE